MISCKFMKNFSHFELRKDIVKSPIFGIKMPIERFLSNFAYTCKGWEVDVDHVFHHPKNFE